ncbi:efflux RND transporter periplasmic adaptor subunit [Candidatus Desantisbacteria bacterium CG_4_9_14_3_um_filter_40_11]|uniref:Efflux RND transporter periplasmic adaptor subunit n=4 Tax=unclassified Candidatus Desantisiibacteriota TaxID=3106372 RepID=A0A2M7JDV3_9BACT|nr:MAG: efflux transporter periplasmic adaptor subunit [Candidatus Desantisbacteria bacterium CG23_combo_of_CG06-09_8_20_14_all_40_23]PIX17536.1 MAG: efflux RND transporter periplasmic adaptor subunit [Candidatus Desantisbacteria bacterium CG_4_8_14_3_um_filter_40_12]PIY18766.1 MAG: efflux RND transporter periplasmic adaptor subunit [Candidatus Desantisbacteria bacterium CG_4_10_14_3_um_filter_40_18]PJB28348.1 MAG: efflux RND transporter periplasmic adaptor subunit [Candidatus Desantisbacteria b
MKRKILALGVILLIISGVFVLTQRYQRNATHQQKTAIKQIYSCPMHPDYTSDRSGQCPICGMTLVLKKASEIKGEKTEKGVIFISPEKQQLIGVKTANVGFVSLQKLIAAKGLVDYDERRIFSINTKFEGWIEKLFVNYTGKLVKKGEPLFTIYSPELVSAQEEYLLSLKNREIGKNSQFEEIKVSSQSMVEATERRLKLWDITDEQIKQLEEKGEMTKTLIVHSQNEGFVIEKMVVEGMKIMPGESLYKIADLSSVWIIADIYEQDIPLVKIGQVAEISLLSGKVLRGRITYIYPYLEGELRTVKVRIEVANPGYVLKPNSYVNVGIKVELGRRLAVVDSAVIDTGERQLVILAREDGHFKPVDVKLGVKVEGFCEVLEGIKEGDEVVTNANFLIDSESRMKEALSGMTGESSKGEHHH